MSSSKESVRVYSTLDREAWDALVTRAWRHDFYHLSGYHALAEDRGEGKALLIEYRRGSSWVALPLLLVRSDSLPGLEGMPVTDATSVYGYAGPLTSHPHLPETVGTGFHRALDNELGRRNVCTVFSRLHPLLDQNRALVGRGEVVPTGTTVSIDLTLDPSEQRRRYRKDHKHGVNKLRRNGVVCEGDDEKIYLERFVQIYRENMQRVEAQAAYMFDFSYFRRLLAIKGVRWRLAVCIRDGQVLCGGVFSLCGGILQYHLSGTASQFLREAPMKLLIDDTRLWGIEQGARVFHLGGGVGSKEDSLFAFKAGFTNERHQFSVWRWVRDPDRYRYLVSKRRDWMAKRGIDTRGNSFFPEYWSPLPKGQVQ